MPGLESRLEQVVETPDPADPVDRETHDRRRASAACALNLLDHGQEGWSLLRFDPRPAARTSLIHILGPANLDPVSIFDRLKSTATEISIRRALIQCLGGIAPETLPPELRDEITAYLLSLYRTHPDSGIHGSAKWLLKAWNHHEQLDEIDSDLAGKIPPEHFQWRLSRDKITFITIDDSTLDRVIEVADSETTVALYLQFRPGARYSPEVSPDPRCPINAVSYFDATEFSMWLSARENLRACYRRSSEGDPGFEPVPGHLDLDGLRLPTDQEFRVICAAGTQTRRYHGDSDLHFDRYAWTFFNSEGTAHPVASLIPNELGIFDTLGNVQEWCERFERRGGEVRARADLRGGWCTFFPASEVDRDTAVVSLDKKLDAANPNPSQGLRLVRTKRIRPHKSNQ
jgi:hypothetical protein